MAAAAAGDPDPLGKSRHRLAAGHRPGHQSGRPGCHAAETAESRESFFAQGAAWRVAAGGALIGLVTLAGFWWGLSQAGYSPGAKGIPEDALAYARTIAFAVLTGSQMMFALSVRSPSEPVLRAGLFRNRLLVGAIAASFLLQVALISMPFTANLFHLRPMGLTEWTLAAALSMVPPLANEGLKRILAR